MIGDACRWRFRARSRSEGGGWYRWHSLPLPFDGTYEEALAEAAKLADVANGQVVPVPVLMRRKVKP